MPFLLTSCRSDPFVTVLVCRPFHFFPASLSSFVFFFHSWWFCIVSFSVCIVTALTDCHFKVKNMTKRIEFESSSGQDNRTDATAVAQTATQNSALQNNTQTQNQLQLFMLAIVFGRREFSRVIPVLSYGTICKISEWAKKKKKWLKKKDSNKIEYEFLT